MLERISEADTTDAFEQLILGMRFRTVDFTITEAEIIEFARSFDPQPIHTDPARAKQSRFKGLVASGWHTAGLTMKLMVDSKLLGDAPLIGVEVDRLRFIEPLRPNDTIFAEAMVIGKRKSRRDDQGYVEFAVSTRRVDGRTVMTQQWTLLVPHHRTTA